MTEPIRDATKKIDDHHYLCANCGSAVRFDWLDPCFGLCQRCDDIIRIQRLYDTPENEKIRTK